MRVLLLISLVALCACASKPYHEVEGGAKTNFDEAANDCEVKSSVAIGDTGANDWGYGIRKKRFMKQCMRGQGYVQD